MADDKNLATLKVTVTADKSPLKKALDSAKQDTAKSTSQIQWMLKKIRKTMSSVSLKGMVKDFQVKSGIKVPTQEFKDATESLYELKRRLEEANEVLDKYYSKREKMEALGVKTESKSWKSLAYDIENAEAAVKRYSVNFRKNLP